MKQEVCSIWLERFLHLRSSHGDAVNSEASDSAASPDAGGSEALLEKNNFQSFALAHFCLFAGRDLDGCELFGQS